MDVVIPRGAAQLARFGLPPPAIPEGMTFRVGDTLIVRNEDAVGHLVGPFFVPTGTSLAIPLRQPGTLRYTCTFLPGRTLGIVVQPAVRTDRLRPLVVFGVPLAVVLGVLLHRLTPRRGERSG